MANIVEILIRGNDQSSRAIASSVKSLQGMDSALSGIGRHLAGIVSITSLVALAHSALQLGDDLSKASEKLGIGAEKLSALSYAARVADVDLDTFQAGMKFFADTITKAHMAGSDAAIAFKAIGVSTMDATGKVKPMDVLLSEVADKFSMMEDGAGKISLAMMLFGMRGMQAMEFIPFLNKGAGGIADLEKEAKKLGATISDKTAKNLEEMNDMLKKTGMISKGVAASLIVDLVGAVEGLWKKVEERGPRLEAFFAKVFGGKVSVPSFGPDAKGDPAPPPPKKIVAPDPMAIKKAMEDAKKAAEDAKKEKDRLDKEYLQLHAKNVSEEGKIVHDALAAEMGMDQEYSDTRTKMRLDDFTEWKKVQEDEAKLLEKFELDKIGMLQDLQDAQRAEMEITEKIGEYRAEDAFNAAMQYGDSATAIRLLNEGLYEQFRIIDEGREKVSAYSRLYNLAFRGMDGVTADLVNATVDGFNRMTDALVDFVMTGKANFRDFANSVIADLMRIAIQQAITKPLYQGIQSGLASIFSVSGKAAGGPVFGGSAYVVGERGPELFVPSSSGSIVPNGGGGRGNVTVNIRNEGGQPVQAKSSTASFDGQGMIVDVVIDAINRNVHGLRTVLGGA